MTDLNPVIPAQDENSPITPVISVAICTYNRADRIEFALEALGRQSLPSQDFEILLIDNASTDNTKEICTRYQQQLSNLRYIYEPDKGLDKARNRAIREAQGEYLAYLDDDAIPCPIWLETIVDTFRTVQPAPVCIGGPIYPLWEIPRPDWIPKEVEYLFSVLDWGNQPHWLRLPKYPYGANMAFDLDALRKVGGFSQELCRQGEKVLLSSDEYMVYRTLIDQGRGLLYYDPQASVQHFIFKKRISLEWLRSRSYWQGRSTAAVARLRGKPSTREWLDILRGLKKGKPLAHAKSLLQAGSDPTAKALAQIKFMQSWGYLMQVWSHTFARKSPVSPGIQPSSAEVTSSSPSYQQQNV